LKDNVGPLEDTVGYTIDDTALLSRAKDLLKQFILITFMKMMKKNEYVQILHKLKLTVPFGLFSKWISNLTGACKIGCSSIAKCFYFRYFGYNRYGHYFLIVFPDPDK